MNIITNKDQFCCEAFSEVAPTFKWMTYAEGEKKGKIFLMPHIDVNDKKWRVNHCPVCGKEVRSIEVHEDVFKEIISEEN